MKTRTIRATPARRAVPWLAALLLAGGLAARAQEQRDPLTDPDRTPPAARTEPRARQLAATLPVLGVTRANRESVRAALEGLTVDAWICPRCDGRRSTPGECAPCHCALEHVALDVVRSAALSPDLQRISLRLVPGERLALSTLEVVLAREGARVERARLELAGHTTLVFAGASEPAHAAALQKALRDSFYFQSVRASLDASSGETRVEALACAMPPTFATIAALVDAVRPPMRLVDVLWSGACPEPWEIHG